MLFFTQYLLILKNFYSTNACICRKCENVYPLGNIHLENRKPNWGNNFNHCMARICRCQKEAIEYGKNTNGRVRYICPK